MSSEGKKKLILFEAEVKIFIVKKLQIWHEAEKWGGGRLVYTILISNLTRLIHWPIHISKFKKHQNTSIEHITIKLHPPKSTITKTTLPEAEVNGGQEKIN